MILNHLVLQTQMLYSDVTYGYTNAKTGPYDLLNLSIQTMTLPDTNIKYALRPVSIQFTYLNKNLLEQLP